MGSFGHAACDSAAALARPDGRKVAHPRLVLLTTILASSLAFVDGSVVNVGLPAIGRTLQGDASALQWVVNAYLLPVSALLLLGGALGDRFGRRRMLIAGTALFALASIACALAPTLATLILARIVQGTGAAMLMPNSLAILGSAFSGEARGRAIGTWAAAGSAAGAVGPVLGGWLIDTSGWRSIFLLNLPIAAAAMALAWFYVRDEADDGPRIPLDLAGALTATGGLAGLTWGLTAGSGREGWTASSVAALVAGIVLSLAFVFIERRRGDKAMAPLALFGSKSFVGLTLLTLLLYGALGGLLVMVPFVLIERAGYSATAAGAALLPFPILIALVSPVMGSLAGKLGPRLPLTLGPLIVAAGFLLAMRIGEGGDYWTTVLPAVLVMSIGMAGAVAPLTTAVLTSVDAHHQGSASGLNSAAARTGGLVTTALLGGVLAARGAALTEAFRLAAMVGAAACLGAAIAAFALVANRKTRPK